MVKKLLSVIAINCACLFATAATTLPSNVTTTDPTPRVDLGNGVKITLDEFFSLTPKQYHHLTGQRLGIKKSVALKVVQKKAKKAYAGGGKSQLTATLLCFFLGGLGIHRFYLGYTWQGIVQLLTLGGLGIWALIDFIRILTGSLQPKDGEYETTL